MSIPATPRLLLVEDDPDLQAMLRDYLEGEGFSCRTAGSVDEMFRRLQHETFNLIVLDVMLPGENGLAALRRLRAADATPVILLTARSADADKILGLELGADDYVPKPFNPQELIARVRAILRRTDAGHALTTSMRVGDLHVHPGSRQVFVGDRAIALTSTEYSVLELLCRKAGRTVNRDELYGHVLGRDPGPYDRSIDVHIASLRRKLGDLPGGATRIATVRGAGYQLTVPLGERQ